MLAAVDATLGARTGPWGFLFEPSARLAATRAGVVDAVQLVIRPRRARAPLPSAMKFLREAMPAAVRSPFDPTHQSRPVQASLGAVGLPLDDHSGLLDATGVADAGTRGTWQQTEFPLSGSRPKDLAPSSVSMAVVAVKPPLPRPAAQCSAMDHGDAGLSAQPRARLTTSGRPRIFGGLPNFPLDVANHE